MIRKTTSKKSPLSPDALSEDVIQRAELQRQSFTNEDVGQRNVAQRNFERVDSENGKSQRNDSAHSAHLVPHFDVRNSDSVSRSFDQVNHILRDGNADPIRTGQAVKHLFQILESAKAAMNSQEWESFVHFCRTHAINETLQQDGFTHRNYVKPRGYSGDAVLLDYVYDAEMGRSPSGMSDIGLRIHPWTVNSSPCNAVKDRRSFIAKKIDEMASENDELEVLSIACGHFREAELSSAILRRKVKRVVVVDTDRESLQVVENSYGRLNVECVLASAKQMITGKLELGKFDFIYSAGLFDYLNDNFCRRLSSKWFSMLNPGGSLLLANFMYGFECLAYMEIFMDWHLIYRDRIQMMAMTAGMNTEEIASIHSFSGPNQRVTYLTVDRNKSS